MREETISNFLCQLLDRLTPPQALRSNQEGQQAEIRHMLSVLLRYAPKDGFETWWREFEARLLESHQTRSWPTVNEVKSAASNGRARDISPAEKEMKILRAATDWFETRGGPHPNFNHDWVTRRLVEGGIVPGHREAMVLGFSQYEEDRKQAKQMRMSDREWKNHIDVLSRLRGTSFSDTEAFEIADVSSPLAIPTDKLPERIAARRTTEAA